MSAVTYTTWINYLLYVFSAWMQCLFSRLLQHMQRLYVIVWNKVSLYSTYSLNTWTKQKIWKNIKIFLTGKSVMVEKPTAETFSDIKTCYDTAENHGAVLLTSFQRLTFQTLTPNSLKLMFYIDKNMYNYIMYSYTM